MNRGGVPRWKIGSEHERVVLVVAGGIRPARPGSPGLWGKAKQLRFQHFTQPWAVGAGIDATAAASARIVLSVSPTVITDATSTDDGAMLLSARYARARRA